MDIICSAIGCSLWHTYHFSASTRIYTSASNTLKIHPCLQHSGEIILASNTLKRSSLSPTLRKDHPCLQHSEKIILTSNTLKLLSLPPTFRHQHVLPLDVPVYACSFSVCAVVALWMCTVHLQFTLKETIFKRCFGCVSIYIFNPWKWPSSKIAIYFIQWLGEC